jgi:hypothetical protein
MIPKRIALPLCLLTLCGHCLAESEPESNSPLFQVFLGSLQLDDQSANWEDTDDGSVDVEFPSSLPGGGIEAEYHYGGKFLHWGINPGGSIAWKNSGTRVSGGFSGDTGGVIRIDLDNSLFLGELHLGGYIRGQVGSKIQLYAAAGPMIMYGTHKVEDEEVVTPQSSGDGQIVITDSDESDFAIGFYGRAGIDFKLKPGQLLGLGVRYMSAEMDFSDTLGKIDLQGPQFVLTYTARY